MNLNSSFLPTCCPLLKIVANVTGPYPIFTHKEQMCGFPSPALFTLHGKVNYPIKQVCFTRVDNYLRPSNNYRQLVLI